jgi:hypothetical protein
MELSDQFRDTAALTFRKNLSVHSVGDWINLLIAERFWEVPQLPLGIEVGFPIVRPVA